MKVGDLVGYEDGDIGIVIEVEGWTAAHLFIQWSDGCDGWHLRSELEVIDEV